MKSLTKTVILGLAGEFLAGKSSAAAFFERKFEAKKLRFSHVLDTILEILDLPNTRENEQELAEILRDLYGPDVLAKALLHSAEKHQGKIFVFDGIRKIEELGALKANENFKLIYVTATPEIRYGRMLARGEKEGEGKYTKEEFAMLIEHPADADIADLEKMADFVIQNNGTVEEFEADLTKCLMQIIW